MHVLVCIKRVPGTGSSVELTADGQAVDTRHLAFTIGPHEECAVEEAVRIVGEHGGAVTVLTVGPDDADEQLRYALSMGAHAAVRVDTGADPLDPQATSAAIAAAVPELDPVDLVLFGNESADAGHYQVGIRVAHALGMPIVGGVKGVSVNDAEPPGSPDDTSRLRRRGVRLERPVPGGVEVYAAPLPAAAAVMEGLNLPRYPSMRGRLRAAKAPIRMIEVEVAAGGLRPLRLHKPPEKVKETVVLGKGAEAAPGLADVLDDLLPDDRSRSAGATSLHEAHMPSEATSSLVASVIELRWTDGAVDAVELPADATAEQCGAALAAEVRRTDPVAVIAPADPFGAEVMAHLAARLDLPLAANCTAVTGGDPWVVTRQRGGGVLLEDAELDAPTKLITVAAGATLFDQPPPEPRSIPLGGEPLATLVKRTSAGGGITLATAPVVVSGGRGVGSTEGFAVLEELAELLGGAVGCSRVVTNNGWRPHSDQVGQTGTKVAPKVYIAAGISGATQHWAGCMGSKTIVAVNTDPDAPMVTRADYAVIGDVGEVLRATVDEIRQRRTR